MQTSTNGAAVHDRGRPLTRADWSTGAAIVWFLAVMLPLLYPIAVSGMAVQPWWLLVTVAGWCAVLVNGLRRWRSPGRNAFLVVGPFILPVLLAVGWFLLPGAA